MTLRSTAAGPVVDALPDPLGTHEALAEEKERAPSWRWAEDLPLFLEYVLADAAHFEPDPETARNLERARARVVESPRYARDLWTALVRATRRAPRPEAEPLLDNVVPFRRRSA